MIGSACLVRDVKTSSPGSPSPHGLGRVERVDDLRPEVVLPDVRAVLGLAGLARHARAHDLGEPVDVARVEVPRLLQLAAHLLRPRLCAEHRGLEARGARVQAHLLHRVRDGQQVRGRGQDRVRLEVLDELDLLLRLAAGHRDDRGAEPLRAVVRAEAAREEAVAVRVVDLVPGLHAGEAEAARHEVGPGADVLGRVAHDSRQARGPRARVDARHLRLRHREHPERVHLPQVLLLRVRELREVLQLLEVRGVHAVRVELLLVERHVLVCVADRPLEALELRRLDLVSRGGHRVLVGHAGGVRVRSGGGVRRFIDDSHGESFCLGSGDRVCVRGCGGVGDDDGRRRRSHRRRPRGSAARDGARAAAELGHGHGALSWRSWVTVMS